MKIIFGTNGTLTPYAGMDNRAVSIANHIINKNNDVFFFTFSNKRNDINLKIKIIEYVPMNLSFEIFYSVSEKIHFSRHIFSKLMSKQLKNINPDFFCVDHPPMDLYALKSRDVINYKLIYTYHTVTDPNIYSGNSHKLLEKQEKHIDEIAKKSDLIIAVSKFARNQLREKGMDSIVIYNGVDINLFKPRILNESPTYKTNNPILLYVGRLVRHKGLHILLESFKQIKKEIKNIKLYVVGSCDDLGYWNELYKISEDVKSSVFYLGTVGNELLSILYSISDLFVCASLHEGFGMPFLEAQSCGVPCIGFNTSAIPEVVLNGKTGILVEKGNTMEMTNAILKLLTETNLRKKMGDAARNHAKKFDWNIIANQFVKKIEKYDV